ncbi:capsular polysaccharide biosynthesis protein [Billgrantia lactosivorans]|uniref:capsular polysaccharide biosynthesis protein n=1 Tax=Billgrantia lactosivorans TaxID=2185141 RepID=UPI000DAB427C|nr:capsular polysaccharide biosynthesis protein [Halomonas lactosivorans]
MSSKPPLYLAATPALLRTPHLEILLEARLQLVRGNLRDRLRPLSEIPEAVLAWGRKPSASRAERLAKTRQLPLLRVEDGFVRSLGLGQDSPPLSLVVDEEGIYYDASAPSALEELARQPLTESETRRVQALVRLWRECRVSKYNHARESVEGLPARYALVVDQTRGDASIGFGLASAEAFEQMLEATLADDPERQVVLKVHPEVAAGRKAGHFDLATLQRQPRVRVVADDVHPVALIEGAECVYTVTSQVGFEALLWGKRVHTFGMPFYAGWGLTADRQPAPQRRRSIALAQLVFAALVRYPRYVDPETGRRCEPERVIEWLGLQRRMRERLPPRMVALGFAPWRHATVRRFTAGSRLRFSRRPESVAPGEAALVWGYKPMAERLPAGTPVHRIEDGFIRSVGLGAHFATPLSWAFDRQGLYYDATRASDLEGLLQCGIEDPELLARAARLRERLVNSGITKYNVGQGSWRRPAGDKRVILVPGQVESDASLAYGASGLCRNMELLQAVRKANPEAHLLYKPHPDVVAGARVKGQGEAGAEGLCDEVLADTAMHQLLDQVDEVHLLTSLTGFEALLRGKRVVCYGQPFYAGWGLTEDILPHPRRRRRLSLDELVAGALIVYPTYVSRTTGHYTTPERVLDELAEWRASDSGEPGLKQRGVQWLFRLLFGLK